MNRATTVLAIILFVITGCVGNRHATDTFITVDVTKSYPEKKLVLQDFMDVEYVVLETTDEFITQGSVSDIGKKNILVTNRNRDGNIYIFDRTGKGLRKINRQGRGPEEYTSIYKTILDEDNDEIFVYDYAQKKIVVYDLYGKFKRSFKYNRDDEQLRYEVIHNYDRNHLICYDASGTFFKERPFCHTVISKQDGGVIRKIELPSKEKKTTMITIKSGEATFTSTVSFESILPYQDQWILAQPSSDTIYRYLPDFSLIPFIVRTPSIHTMNQELFLYPELITENYYFLMVMGTDMKVINDNVTLPQTQTRLMYDRREKALFKYTVYHGDFTNERKISMNSGPVNDEIAACRTLGADQLVTAYQNGQLTGKLKEIAAELNVEDNPVIMVIKYTK